MNSGRFLPKLNRYSAADLTISINRITVSQSWGTVRSPDNHAPADTKYCNRKVFVYLYHKSIFIPAQGRCFRHSAIVRLLTFLVNILLIVVQILCHTNLPAMSTTVEMVDLFSHSKNSLLFCISSFSWCPISGPLHPCAFRYHLLPHLVWFPTLTLHFVWKPPVSLSSTAF